MLVTNMFGDERWRQETFTLGLAFVLCIAFLDVSLNLLLGRSSYPDFSFVLLPIAATASFYFVFLLIWMFVIPVLKKWFGLSAWGLMVFFVSSLTIQFVLVVFNDLMTYKTVLVADKLAQFLVLSGLAFLMAITFYRIHAVRELSEPTLARKLVATAMIFCLSVPAVWLQTEKVGSIVSLMAALNSIGFGVAVYLLWRLARRIVRITGARKVLGVMTLAVLLAPLIVFVDVSLGEDLPQSQAADLSVRNVLLITVDTLRRDFVSVYSERPKARTPNIDQLTRDGIVFDNALSPAPWTLAALSSVMTGLPPAAHLTVSPTARLPETAKTLAEFLSERGYLTAAVGRNGFLSPRHNLSQGFQDYNVFPRSNGGDTFGALVLRVVGHLMASDVVPNSIRSVFLNTVVDRASTANLTDLTTQWLNANAKKNFFFWLHYLDPHDPYAPPRKNFRPPPLAQVPNTFTNQHIIDVRTGFLVLSQPEKQWVESLYAAEVEHVDANIGSVLRALKDLGIYDETLIVLTSDHGEEFWEHGSCGHGHSLFQELLAVPLIIKLPHSSAPARVSSAVSTQSILPTILELCGVQHEPLPVTSLVDYWTLGEGQVAPKPVFSSAPQLYGNKEAVVFDGMKYIRSILTGKEQLFDLERDPMEQDCVAKLLPEQIKVARKLLDEQSQRVEIALARLNLAGTEDADLDEATIRRLRSLGYLK